MASLLVAAVFFAQSWIDASDEPLPSSSTLGSALYKRLVEIGHDPASANERADALYEWMRDDLHVGATELSAQGEAFAEFVGDHELKAAISSRFNL